MYWVLPVRGPEFPGVSRVPLTLEVGKEVGRLNVRRRLLKEVEKRSSW